MGAGELSIASQIRAFPFQAAPPVRTTRDRFRALRKGLLRQHPPAGLPHHLRIFSLRFQSSRVCAVVIVVFPIGFLVASLSSITVAYDQGGAVPYAFNVYPRIATLLNYSRAFDRGKWGVWLTGFSRRPATGVIRESAAIFGTGNCSITKAERGCLFEWIRRLLPIRFVHHHTGVPPVWWTSRYLGERRMFPCRGNSTIAASLETELLGVPQDLSSWANFAEAASLVLEPATTGTKVISADLGTHQGCSDCSLRSTVSCRDSGSGRPSDSVTDGHSGIIVQTHRGDELQLRHRWSRGMRSFGAGPPDPRVPDNTYNSIAWLASSSSLGLGIHHECGQNLHTMATNL